MRNIIPILFLILIATFQGCQNNPTDTPITYNASVDGYITFEEGTPDTLIAEVKAFKEGVSTLMEETATDTNGYFIITQLSYGNYQLNISANNYEEFTLQGINLNPYDTTSVDTVNLDIIRTIEIRTIVINGEIDSGWESVYENTHESNWGSANNFDNLYLARDEDSLYVAVDGGFDSGENTVNIYIDKDYGAGTGINDFSTISGGEYGDHLRKTVLTPENYGADLAFSVWALEYQMGVVSLEYPTSVDENILEANISLNDSVIEFAISFEQIYESGNCPVGSKIAIVAIIGGGDDDYVCDDTIPQQDDPHNFMTVFSRQY